VVQYDNKDDGKIIGKGFFTVQELYSAFVTTAVYKWDVYYSTEITCKNGKYRYRLYDINIQQTVRVNSDYPTRDNITLDEAYKYRDKGTTKKLFRKLLNKTALQFKNTTEGIKKYMVKEENKQSKDDF
jgi:hypothetical protein